MPPVPAPRESPGTPARRRILFVMYQPRRFSRLFEGMIRHLAERGHEVHLAVEPPVRQSKRGSTRGSRGPSRVQEGIAPEHVNARRMGLVGDLCAEYENVTAGPASTRDDEWITFVTSLRRGIDYLRYLAPVYRDAAKLRARAERAAPRLVVRLARWPLLRSPRGLALLDAVLRWLERSVPNSPAIDEFLRERRPDLVLLTPLVMEPSEQADYVRSSVALGLRSGLLVASWDNLTNKGLIRNAPDRVYVWNQDQLREAVELHGVPAERVRVTGAHSFDQWYGWRPTTAPEEFRERVGLPPEQPILLYLCSSGFVASDEPSFVERWVEALRSHGDERVRHAGVLVRPHPKSGHNWRDTDLARLPGVVVWPPTGASPDTEQAKSDYFDSMYHCAAVVGLNTSALIESTIVGRPAYTVLVPEFQGGQEGTLHFHYLLRENGGPLRAARSLDEHLSHLAAALDGESGWEEVRTGFLTRFVRPHGDDRAATAILVDAIEEQLQSPASQPAYSRFGRVLPRLVLRPMAVIAGWRQRHPRSASRRLVRGASYSVRRRRPSKAVRRWSKRQRKRLGRASRSLPAGWGGVGQSADASGARADDVDSPQPTAAGPPGRAGSFTGADPSWREDAR